MLKRTMDAGFLNGIANHPDVRPFLGGSGKIDLQPLLNEAKNVGLQAEGGGFVVQNLGDGLYEWHSMFHPNHRGAEVIHAMRSGARYMFVETDCTEIITKCPNKGAIGAARAMGCDTVFSVENGWFTDGKPSPMECATLRIENWAQRDEDCKVWGNWFHERLETLTTEAGAKIPVHYDEPSHIMAAGAATMMYRTGNAVKATKYYNRWVAHAGFPGVFLLNINPVVLDMHQVIITVRDGDFEVLKCVHENYPVGLREVA